VRSGAGVNGCAQLGPASRMDLDAPYGIRAREQDWRLTSQSGFDRVLILEPRARMGPFPSILESWFFASDGIANPHSEEGVDDAYLPYPDPVHVTLSDCDDPEDEPGKAQGRLDQKQGNQSADDSAKQSCIAGNLWHHALDYRRLASTERIFDTVKLKGATTVRGGLGPLETPSCRDQDGQAAYSWVSAKLAESEPRGIFGAGDGFGNGGAVVSILIGM
jgi:hypothetical protein